MMLNNSRKADQSKGLKTEPKFDFILEQIFNLDSQHKTLEARCKKISSKTKDKKNDLRDPCPYYSKPSYIEEKYYNKNPKYTSQNFWERFKDWIQELQLKANTTRSHINIEVNIDNTFEYISSENWSLIIPTKGRILVIEGYDKN